MSYPPLPTDGETNWGPKLRAWADALENRAITPGLQIIDDGDKTTIRLEDTANHAGSIINLHHRGDGSVNPQSYALNIANHQGASRAFVIHQYSAGNAMQIDNTDIGPSIIIKNTENQTMNPGGQGTGSFIQLMPYGKSGSLQLLDNLTWLNTTDRDMRVQATNSSVYAFGIRADADKIGLLVEKNGTGSGNAAWIINKGSGVGLFVGQNSETGTGVALQVTNRGLGVSFRVQDGAGDVMRVLRTGEIELMAPSVGVIMRSSNGSRFKFYVNNSGEMQVIAL